MIHTLCAEGNLELVEHWIDKFPDEVNLVNDQNETPLFTACEYGRLSCASLLIEQGGDVRITNIDGETALHKVAEHGHIDTVELLVSHHANINAMCNLHETPIMRAIRRNNDGMVLYLLSKGADTCLYDQYGSTPLMIALRHGKHDLAMKMVHLGASIRGSRKESPLMLAAKFDQPLFIQTILPRVLCDKKQCTDTLTILLSESFNFDLVKHMLEQGVDVNRNAKYGVPLHRIARVSYINQENNPAISFTNLLLSFGANINARGENNDTVILIATRTSNYELVEHLLYRGADSTLKNNFGRTPLMEACELDDIHLVRLLMPYSKLHQKLTRHKNYLMCAASVGNVDMMIQLLYNHKFDIHDKDMFGHTAQYYASHHDHGYASCFLNQIELAQQTTTMDHIEDVILTPRLWRRMLPPEGKRQLYHCIRSYLVDSRACYHALFLNEARLLRKFRQGECVDFSKAPIRTLTRAMGSRPIRTRIVSYLIFLSKSRRIFSNILGY